jgi:DNA repair protein RecN (Recombination protein N)
MLIELRIKDFAIIHHLDLKFGPGLITFTGETGAGKSIILDAIMTLLGGRADNELVRTGAERAMVEATFNLPAQNRAEIQQLLESEALVDEDNPGEIILSRELRLGGRSVARINGHSVSVGLMRELGGYFVDIHGQTDHLSLLNERSHLPLLDRFSDSEALLKDYQATYHKLIGLRRELNELRKSEQEAARQKDFLDFQISEIQGARLSAGEDDELTHERDRLANAEKLAALGQESLLILEGGGPETPAVADLLGQVVRLLSQLSRIDPSQTDLLNQVETGLETLNDVTADLQAYLEQVEYNPRRLVQVEERLNMINNLKRKYGSSIAEILAFGAEAQKKLERLTHADERIAEIELEEQELFQELARRGSRLSSRRRQAAQEMAQAVEGELNDLSMVEARFMVDQHFQADDEGVELEDGQRVRFDGSGLDRVAFLIAANPGEGFKPLAKTASGGETSRLMLALKNVLARADYIPTLIFDEIDQGIGGRVGTVVGEKLWQLAHQHQVLCVTHLPQLAAFGNEHFRVYKEIDGGRTFTRADRLDQTARIEELTAMLGATSSANRRAAEEALHLAQQRVTTLSSTNEKRQPTK